MKEVTTIKKMTINEYQSKYSKRENRKAFKTLYALLSTLVILIAIYFLFSLVSKVFDINEYAGYASIVVAIFVLIFGIIVPLSKIRKLDYFVTNFKNTELKQVKRHNKELRRNIASKMVELSDNVDVLNWYEESKIDVIRGALLAKDDELINKSLQDLYNTSIKKTADLMIVKAAVKSGLYSALSVDEKIDTLLVTTSNLQLLKNIFYLYGFRPSDAQMIKITSTILSNALVAYGVNQAGNYVGKLTGNAFKDIPVVGGIVATIVGSSVQGLSNGILTTILGYQAISYLQKEYHLQTIVDGIVEIDPVKEVESASKSVEKELSSATKKSIKQ